MPRHPSARTFWSTHSPGQPARLRSCAWTSPRPATRASRLPQARIRRRPPFRPAPWRNRTPTVRVRCASHRPRRGPRRRSSRRNTCRRPKGCASPLCSTSGVDTASGALATRAAATALPCSSPWPRPCLRSWVLREERSATRPRATRRDCLAAGLASDSTLSGRSATRTGSAAAVVRCSRGRPRATRSPSAALNTSATASCQAPSKTAACRTA